jgi:MscS family membrane protein
MKDLPDILTIDFLGNSIGAYAMFFLIIILGIMLRRFISKVSNRLFYYLIRHKAEGVPMASFQALLARPVGFTLMLVVVFIAFSQLSFPAEWNIKPKDVFGVNMILYRGFFVLLYAGIIWIGLRLADFFRLVLIERSKQTEIKSLQMISFGIDSLKVILVIFGILVILSSIFLVNVGTLVAGLGIGGLAVALAARESLENLFGSFTIFLDKPFVVGDLVKVGEIVGSVEKVGFRSSRLRTLDKSYVTLPNKKMIDSDLENLTLRTFRRANFSIGLAYHTSIDQMRAIVRDIQEVIDTHPNTNEEGRVRFKEFGESSLEIMIMYYVDTMDWTIYLNVREEINYRIMEIVASHEASFAFPSRSIYMEKTTT